MRTALILVGLGTLVAMELEAPPRTAKAVIEPKSQSTVGISHSRDTLKKADRLEIHDVQQEAPARPISFGDRMPAVDSTAIIAKKGAVMLPKPRPKHTDAKRAANTDRSKATIEIKSCRPNAFDSLLKALNLSPGCET